MPVTHIAGLRISVDSLRRQRCAWCGAVLVDYDLRNLAVPVDQDPEPAMWEPGAQVAIDEHMSYLVDGVKLPDDSCTQIDPEVTV